MGGGITRSDRSYQQHGQEMFRTISIYLCVFALLSFAVSAGAAEHDSDTNCDEFRPAAGESPKVKLAKADQRDRCLLERFGGGAAAQDIGREFIALAERADDAETLDVQSLYEMVTQLSPGVVDQGAEATRLILDLQENNKDRQEAQNQQEFLGFRWGLGVGAAFGDSRRVSSAEVVDGVVRVTKTVTDSPRIVLEIHNFWLQYKDNTLGIGPFAAVNFGATDGDTLTSFGGGVMVGAKRPGGSGSFNLGIGYMLDQNVKRLGDGIVEGAPLPGDETEIRFKEESDGAFLVFVSTTF